MLGRDTAELATISPNFLSLILPNVCRVNRYLKIFEEHEVHRDIMLTQRSLGGISRYIVLKLIIYVLEIRVLRAAGIDLLPVVYCLCYRMCIETQARSGLTERRGYFYTVRINLLCKNVCYLKCSDKIIRSLFIFS